MTDASEFFRADDITRLTGLSLRTVRRWIAEEILPSVKVRGARLVPRSNECSRPHHRTGPSSQKKPSKRRGLAQCRENIG